MREGWKYEKLGKVLKTGAGGTPLKSRKDYYENGNIPWIRSGEVDNRNIIDSRIKITEEGLNNSSAKLFPSQTVVIAMYGATAGEVGILNFECATNQAVCGIFPNENFIPEFLFYFFLKFKDELIAQAVGNAQPNISQTKIRNTLIPIISITEQKQIVTLLDQALATIDQAKANIEKNIANAKELFQSKLNEIFSQKGDGWEEKKLIEVNRFIDYRGKTPKKTDSGIKLITAKNVRMGYMRIKPEEYIAEKDYASWMTRGIPEKGDVLFTTEAPLANVTLLNTSEKIALAQRIITLCPNREILSGDYLSYCLQSKPIQDKILEKGTGATVTGIKSKLLKEILIPIAPTKVQKKIVKELDQFVKLSSELANSFSGKLQNLEDLKKSLLQKAFTGELTSPKKQQKAKTTA